MEDLRDLGPPWRGKILKDTVQHACDRDLESLEASRPCVIIQRGDELPATG